MSNGFSDFLVFVDESGDHGLDCIDPAYPVFVLAFCVMRKADYMKSIVPTIQAFKFKHYGHKNVILHEWDIRKDIGAFAFLKSKEQKTAFLDELTRIVAAAPFTLVCSVIQKEALTRSWNWSSGVFAMAGTTTESNCRWRPFSPTRRPTFPVYNSPTLWQDLWV